MVQCSRLLLWRCALLPCPLWLSHMHINERPCQGVSANTHLRTKRVSRPEVGTRRHNVVYINVAKLYFSRVFTNVGVRMDKRQRCVWLVCIPGNR